MTATLPPAVNASTNGKLGQDAYRAYVDCNWYELALGRHGWSGERLQLTARRITNDYVKANIPYLSPERRDDLCDFVVEKALQATLRFKPQHPTKTYTTNGGSHYDSWICDIMWNRCPDWLRSKAEGNGDKRYGNDNRIVLSTMEDDADHDADFDKLSYERRLNRWGNGAVLANEIYQLNFSNAEWWSRAIDVWCVAVEQEAERRGLLEKAAA